MNTYSQIMAQRTFRNAVNRAKLGIFMAERNFRYQMQLVKNEIEWLKEKGRGDYQCVKANV